MGNQVSASGESLLHIGDQTQMEGVEALQLERCSGSILQGALNQDEDLGKAMDVRIILSVVCYLE